MFIDNYSLSMFQHCPRRYQYRMIWHLVPKESKELAAQFGIAIHKALEVLFKSGALSDAMDAFRNYFEPLGIEDNKRNISNGITILQNYKEIYGSPLSERFNVIANEKIYKADLGGQEEQLYHGILDKLIQYKDGPRAGEYWIMDHKTSSSPMAFVERPNHQATGYIWIAKENGYDVKGCVFDLLGVYVENTKKAVGERFTRRETTRSEHEIDQWKVVVRENIYRIELYMVGWELWPQFDDCSSYGGCAYKDLCLARDKKTMELIKGEFYTKKPWEEMVKTGRGR